MTSSSKRNAKGFEARGFGASHGFWSPEIEQEHALFPSEISELELDVQVRDCRNEIHINQKHANKRFVRQYDEQ